MSSFHTHISHKCYFVWLYSKDSTGSAAQNVISVYWFCEVLVFLSLIAYGEALACWLWSPVTVCCTTVCCCCCCCTAVVCTCTGVCCTSVVVGWTTWVGAAGEVTTATAPVGVVPATTLATTACCLCAAWAWACCTTCWTAACTPGEGCCCLTVTCDCCNCCCCWTVTVCGCDAVPAAATTCAWALAAACCTVFICCATACTGIAVFCGLTITSWTCLTIVADGVGVPDRVTVGATVPTELAIVPSICWVPTNVAAPDDTMVGKPGVRTAPTEPVVLVGTAILAQGLSWLGLCRYLCCYDSVGCLCCRWDRGDDLLDGRCLWLPHYLLDLLHHDLGQGSACLLLWNDEGGGALCHLLQLARQCWKRAKHTSASRQPTFT